VGLYWLGHTYACSFGGEGREGGREAASRTLRVWAGAVCACLVVFVLHFSPRFSLLHTGHSPVQGVLSSTNDAKSTPVISISLGVYVPGPSRRVGVARALSLSFEISPIALHHHHRQTPYLARLLFVESSLAVSSQVNSFPSSRRAERGSRLCTHALLLLHQREGDRRARARVRSSCRASFRTSLSRVRANRHNHHHHRRHAIVTPLVFVLGG
jgi:hypothetical protein